jgi:hypothetical protein
LTVKQIREQSAVLHELEQKGAIKIIGSMYRSEHGQDFAAGLAAVARNVMPGRVAGASRLGSETQPKTLRGRIFALLPLY